MKDDSSGGRKDRKIELGVEIYGRGDRTQQNSELTLKKSNFINENNMSFFLTIIPFIGLEI